MKKLVMFLMMLGLQFSAMGQSTIDLGGPVKITSGSTQIKVEVRYCINRVLNGLYKLVDAGKLGITRADLSLQISALVDNAVTEAINKGIFKFNTAKGESEIKALKIELYNTLYKLETYEGYTTNLPIIIKSAQQWKGGSAGYTIREGQVAAELQKYFTGLKQALFKSAVSDGKKRISPNN